MHGQAIYESFVNADVSGLSQSGFATERVAANYEFRTSELSRLSTSMERAWQGKAAGSADRGASPLIIRHAAAAPQISNVATSIRQQVEAVQTAKMSVVPVPPMPDKPGFFDNVFSLGGANSSYEKNLAAVDSANDHNVAVMAQYENTTRQNASLLAGTSPELRQLPPLPNYDVAEPIGPGTPIAHPGPNQVGPPRGGGSAGTAQGGTSSSAQPQFASGPAATGADPGQTGAQATSTAPSGMVTPDGGSPRPTLVPLPDGPRSGQLFGPVSAGYGPDAGPTLRGMPGVPREAGAVSGPRGTGGGESGGRGGGTSGPGSRGFMVAEGTAGRGTTGRVGAPGAGGLGGGTRKGDSAEDYEHERPSFLVEADPDELFGNTESAAPPVIGG